MDGLKALLLAAPSSQLSNSAKTLVEQWAGTPSALDLLRLLDDIVRYASGSDFVVAAVNEFLELALIKENISYAELEDQAFWRKIIH